MVNIYSKKNNALNYAIAFFSGLTFLASGIAIAFPSAVLSLGLLVPLIAVCGVLSLTAFVLAGQAVSKNEVISEKDGQIEDLKEATLKQKNTLNQAILEQESTLNHQGSKIKHLKQVISRRNAHLEQESTLNRQGSNITHPKQVISRQNDQSAESSLGNTQDDAESRSGGLLAICAPEDIQPEQANEIATKPRSDAQQAKSTEPTKRNWGSGICTMLGSITLATCVAAADYYAFS
ncbi:hypothetical protein [Wolbachia endosymbiont of Folsomia candida]|uniref:hypothetical protein n=1 Tax=Wolbachia endosymbiont of Folsomia candida TaxID=169402 RepID=UPI000A61DADF|nr:hypothetical protein [Wolbachia endosymbiont of Folsomia candida]APR97766.1 hypothetical protein ASM33_00185 [Wolbachia endosymbiont of Folsomia candida]